MKAGPDIARIASLVGDPARANMLTALMSGRALTATELAHEAGVTPQTASAHLAKLEAGGLVLPRRQGRHRYFALSNDDVARMIEGLMGVAARAGHLRTRTGPREPALRHARVCYDHLAGEMGVALYEGLLRRGHLVDATDEPHLTAAGEKFVTAFGIDLQAIRGRRRPLCRSCLDWSARRSHLGGSLGAGILARIYDLGWADRVEGTRIVRFTGRGDASFRETFL